MRREMAGMDNKRPTCGNCYVAQIPGSFKHKYCTKQKQKTIFKLDDNLLESYTSVWRRIFSQGNSIKKDVLLTLFHVLSFQALFQV